MCACMNWGGGGGICVYVRVSDTGVHCAQKASEPLSLFRTQLEVQCPPGVTIGFVAEHWNLCRASYSIQNEKKESMMRVRGPCATYGCGSDSVFEVNICPNGASALLTSAFYIRPCHALQWIFMWVSQVLRRKNYLWVGINPLHVVPHGYLTFFKMWVALPF